MVPKIRKDNTFKHNWAIRWNGDPEDFSDATDINLTAIVIGQYKKLERGTHYRIDGNIIKIDCTPSICNRMGVYKLELKYKKPNSDFIDGQRRSAVDLNAFEIVPDSAQANVTQDISTTSDAIVGFNGKNSFQVWKETHEGDISNYEAWLRQPAMDAAREVTEAVGQFLSEKSTEISDVLSPIQEAETARVNAEGDATNGRVKAENERVAAEEARVNAEGDATKGRVKAENERVQAESERAQAFEQMMGEADDKIEEMDTTLSTYDGRVTQVESDVSQLAGELNQNSNLGTTSKNVVGAINELHSGLATKASHGYVSDPKTLRDVEDQLSTRIDRHQESLNDLLGIPDVFGYRFQVGQADDRVEAVNDVAYDYSTGYAPAGSKRAKLLDKMRPYQCDLDGSNREYLQDDVRKTAGWKDSQLANPEKLQLVRIPHFFYRSFVLDGWNYVLFSELPPEKMEVFSDATQWKEILPCGYARYRGIRQPIEGVQKLLSFSGANPTTSVSLINFQTSAKNVNTKATVTPYYIYEAVAMLMVLDLGRRNAQLFYAGITNAGTSYANAAATGVTDTLSTPSGEVDVEWETGSFTKQFRWRFIECFYGQIWNFLTGIYYVYDSANDVNKVFITRDPDKINTNSNYVDYVEVGNTPSVNGWIKEFIPGTIVAGELGGSSTTYASDYNYTSKSGTTRCARAGGHSASGGNAGPFALASHSAPSTATAYIGASLVLLD